MPKSETSSCEQPQARRPCSGTNLNSVSRGSRAQEASESPNCSDNPGAVKPPAHPARGRAGLDKGRSPLSPPAEATGGPRPFPTGTAGPGGGGGDHAPAGRGAEAAMLWSCGLRELCGKFPWRPAGGSGQGRAGGAGPCGGRAEAAAPRPRSGPRTRGKRAALALRRPRSCPAPAQLPAPPLAIAAVSQRPGPSRAPHSCSLVACWCILLFAIKRGGFFFFCSVSAAINSWSLKHLPFYFCFFFLSIFFFFFFSGRSEQFFAASIYFSISYLY